MGQCGIRYTLLYLKGKKSVYSIYTCICIGGERYISKGISYTSGFQAQQSKSLKLVWISSPTPRLSPVKSASRVYMNSRLVYTRIARAFLLPTLFQCPSESTLPLQYRVLSLHCVMHLQINMFIYMHVSFCVSLCISIRMYMCLSSLSGKCIVKQTLKTNRTTLIY